MHERARICQTYYLCTGTAVFPPSQPRSSNHLSPQQARHRQPTQRTHGAPFLFFSPATTGGDSQSKRKKISNKNTRSLILPQRRLVRRDTRHTSNKPTRATKPGFRSKLAFPFGRVLEREPRRCARGDSLLPRTSRRKDSERRVAGKGMPKSTAKERNPSTGERRGGRIRGRTNTPCWVARVHHASRAVGRVGVASRLGQHEHDRRHAA